VRLVIFTDLDGTLLDGAYSFQAASSALALVRRASIPCVINSSKTASEIGLYREMLGNREPFICENGGGIVIPRGYFGPDIASLLPTGTPSPDAGNGGTCDVIRLGAPYSVLRSALCSLQAMGYGVTGFGDMTAGDIAAATGLAPDEALLAKEREFDEPFIVDPGDVHRLDDMEAEAGRRGLRIIRGDRLCHLTGASDKGRATRIVAALYGNRSPGDFVSAGLGDTGPRPAHAPIRGQAHLMQRPDGSYELRLRGRGFAEAKYPGPAGWNEAVIALLGELDLLPSPKQRR
jgi:mannosyl-3-phosphoglycerate phosphatase